MTMGVARPGTKAVSSDQASPAKIEGITGCFSMRSTALPSLPSRRPRTPPCAAISSRNEESVSRISEFSAMIISNGTRPASPKA